MNPTDFILHFSICQNGITRIYYIKELISKDQFYCHFDVYRDEESVSMRDRCFDKFNMT